MRAAELAAKLRAKRSGNGWMARCVVPGHDDHTPSLHISESTDGKILVRCHGHCSQEAVISALRDRGLWQGKRSGRAGARRPDLKRSNTRAPDIPSVHPTLGRYHHHWDYLDADDKHVLRICRWDQDGRKLIRPLELSGERWSWGLSKHPRPLYRLPELQRNRDMRVLVVEGEKTADAAAKIISEMIVTTWSGGAAVVDKTDWQPLRGRDVTLLADNDAPGATAMDQLGDHLAELQCVVRRVDLEALGELPAGWDCADLEGTASVDESKLIEVIRSAPMRSSPVRSLASHASLALSEQTAALAPQIITDTDMANARRLAQRHGRDIRFTPERGWLTWDGRRWSPDEKSVQLQAKAKDTALGIFDEVKAAGNRDATYSHAKRSQSKTAIEAMITLARSEPGIYASLKTFDSDGWLFNVGNGTVNLRTGQLQPHRREDLISSISDIVFAPEASYELWEKFLARATGGDGELQAYLQRFVGYLLVGDTSEQVLHFLFGLGANGKSVFCELIMRLMGEYAIAVSPDLVMLKRHSSIPNDIARLRGVRAAMMNETNQGARFDEAKLKDLTGGDTLTARFLHQEFFDFAPTHRIIIRGNHKPAINGTDEGIWRRLRLVPFTVTIPEAERDHQLLQKLEAELPGILNWAIAGCLEWQRTGLRPPAIVTEAVKAYRDESDTLGRFIDECCVRRPLAQVRSSVFFERYQKFAEAAGERWMQSKELPGEMQRRGFGWKRTKTGGVYIGLDLPTSDFGQWEEGDGR